MKANDAPAHITVACAHCGREFETYTSSGKRYCSMSCAITARNLTDWNPSYHRDLSGPNNPMYGTEGLRGEKNPMYGKYGTENPAYKHGRKVRRDGYIMILAPDGHPVRSNPYPYILEHRLVMEQHLGRYLEPDEVVHHIDGNPSNNAIENLRLCKNQAEHISNGHPHHGESV